MPEDLAAGSDEPSHVGQDDVEVVRRIQAYLEHLRQHHDPGGSEQRGMGSVLPMSDAPPFEDRSRPPLLQRRLRRRSPGALVDAHYSVARPSVRPGSWSA